MNACLKSRLLVCAGLAMFLSAGRAQEDATKTRERKSPEIFQVAVALEREKIDEQWERLFDLVAAIQKDVETKAEQLPYKDRKALVDVTAHRQLAKAKAGLHSRWSESRHVSKTPPGPGGTYIHTAVAVILVVFLVGSLLVKLLSLAFWASV